MLEQKAGKVSVKAFIPGDEFIREGQARHQASLLQPEDRREASAEEDSLNSREGDEPLGVGGVVGVDPTESPLCFLLDGRDGLDGIEQLLLLPSILDVGVDEERVYISLWMFSMAIWKP